MNKLIPLLISVTIWASAATSVVFAEIIIQVGNYDLLVDTPNQLIDILLISTDPLNDSQISGSNLHVEIGDGTGPLSEPILQGVEGTLDGVDFEGGIFAGNIASGEGPITGFPQLVDAGIVSAGNLTPSGVFVTLEIDTSGFMIAGEIFPLRLANLITPFPSDTELLGPLGSAFPIPITINNGSIQLVAPFIPTGDFDSDGDIDGSDFLQWQREFGNPVSTPGEGADGNGDGIVNQADLLLWEQQYGLPGSSPLTATPEPSSLLLASLAISSLWLSSRRIRYAANV